MNAQSETAWLIEWPADRQSPVRYWHPIEGHVIDPNHAVRFCREEDAQAVLKREWLFGGARPVEHMWCALSTDSVREDHLADALDCFWNAAIGSAREAQDSTAMAVAGALAEGFSAIANRLREHQPARAAIAKARSQ